MFKNLSGFTFMGRECNQCHVLSQCQWRWKRSHEDAATQEQEHQAPQ